MGSTGGSQAWAPWRGAAGTLFPLLGMVATLLPSGVGAVPRDQVAHAATPGPALLGTSLLSPARVPRTLQALYARQRVDANLARDLSPLALGRAAAAASCAEVAQGGRVIFQYNAEMQVVPASNMKLLTATALLDKLGAGYRFTTKVLASAPPVRGVVHGNLYLLGGGDPLLRLPSFAAVVPGGDPVYTNVTQLVTLLEADGVRQVTGSVVGNDGRYDTLRDVPGWPSRYAAEGDVGPLSALGIDDGFATAGAPVPVWAAPEVQSAGVLTKLARAAHIDIKGAPAGGPVPAGATLLAEVVSPPLDQILGEVLRESDNTAMELLTKELGLRVRGVGSTSAGISVVRADLAADGLPLHGFVNVDGSGLSPSDRVTCSLLLAVLERSGPDGLLVRDLPVAGTSGTLADRLVGTAAAGRVQAKTGTLDGVTALSGWVSAVRGQGEGNPVLRPPVAFAIVLNGLSTSLRDPDALVDRAALDLARYPSAPVLQRFEPGL
jgi:D-alanyl-D-alanine carboxypeptidase/D-alanyl-D-alanine-endopeptidase (penicillin-binding protein 4)